jgi:Na+/H+ antiporter NhaC
MRPVTDKHSVSREKLAYLIDATAAPVCIIAPISSWAAAVTGFVEGANGFELFIRAIPYNFYAFLTFVMMITITLGRFDYGPMGEAERNLRTFSAPDGSLRHSSLTGAEDQPVPPVSSKGKVAHLVVPIISLIICCIIGMIYTGGFFEGTGFVEAFSNADASAGLVYGSMAALFITILFYLVTRVLGFNECMNSIPEGFKSMVPAILILTLAWTLKSMTDSLDAGTYVASLVEKVAGNGMVMGLLPAFVFITGAFLAFATGTSWGTFGLLIPIVVSAFHSDVTNELMIVSISACMAGAVCGDHCSPISDTTIMASAGGQCEHIRHVSTQLPYAITVAAVSVVCYIMAGFICNWLITLPVSIIIMVAVLLIIRSTLKNKKTVADNK